jgi:hypothetical protein
LKLARLEQRTTAQQARNRARSVGHLDALRQLFHARPYTDTAELHGVNERQEILIGWLCDD